MITQIKNQITQISARGSAKVDSPPAKDQPTVEKLRRLSICVIFLKICVIKLLLGFSAITKVASRLR